MAVEEQVGIEERDNTAVQQPNIEVTAETLEKQPAIRSVALTGLFVLAIFYTLYFAREFFIPVTLAIVFNFLLGPFVRGLKRVLRLPVALGAGIVMIGTFAILGVIVYEFAPPVTQWIAKAPEITGKLSSQIQRFRRPVDKVTQATEQVGKLAAPTAPKAPQVEIKQPGFMEGVFTQTGYAIFGLAVFITLLYFLLASGDLFLRKLVHVLPKLRDQKRAVTIIQQIEDSISKYLITVAMVNACLGTAAGIVFWALGMPNPALWGALGFLLNFIPYVGALTEIAIVGIIAAATFPNLAHAVLIPASYLGLAVLEGSFVTPYVMGRRLTLNPVVVFAAVTFWGFLWGFAGVFLAVPTLVMFKIFCDHIEPLAPIGEFIGS